MPLICPKCGAENRETAKFCLKCAQQMVPLGGAEPEPPAPQRRRPDSTTWMSVTSLYAIWFTVMGAVNSVPSA